MSKTRIAILKSDKESVLKEFNHKCALCGSENPQVHHINNDPSDNRSENLIPLCPNCHLSDQHNPTDSYPINLLTLFRKYKDPFILSPQFYPIFKKMGFLFVNVEELETNSNAQVKSLIDFIASFKMGEYYQRELEKIIKYPGGIIAFSLSGDNSELLAKQRARDFSEFKTKLSLNRDKAIELIVEMIRYQDWNINYKKYIKN